MVQTKTKEIKGKSYQVTPFMAIEGLRLKAYLVKLVGPALSELAGNVNSLDSEINGNSISKVIEKLTEALDENSFIALIKRLLQNVIVNWVDEEGGKHAVAFAQDFETSLNVVFQGELFSIYPVLAFVLEVNYPDFFGKITPLIGKKMSITSILEKGDSK